MVKRIVLFVTSFILIAICAMALIKPSNSILVYEIEDENDKTVKELYVKDITKFHDCYLDGDDKIIVNGADPYIVFSNINLKFKSAVLNLNNNTSILSAQLYEDDYAGYKEQNSVSSFFARGYNQCVFPIKSGKIKGLRIDIDKNYHFSSLELHSSSAVSETVKSDITVLEYFKILLISLFCSAVILLIDFKTRFFATLIGYTKKHSKTILKLIISAVSCAAIAGIAEYFITLFGTSSANNYFNIYRFVFVFGTLFCVSVFFVFFKSISGNPEKVFLCISLSICLIMVIVCPFGHASWDIDNHYKWVLNASYLGKTSYITQADINVEYVSSIYWPQENININSKNISEMNEDYKVIIGVEDGDTTVAHIPSGLFFAIGRLFKLSFYEVITFAKMASALVYCFVCFFAIKRLKSGKMIAVVVSLIPTSLFLATNFSYDYWVNCFALLGMAYYVSAMQEEYRPITLKETLIMCTAFAVASLPKLIYAVLLVIPFFMRPKKIKNRKQYYLICASAIVVVLALFLFNSVLAIKGGGDLRGGTEVSTGGQIKFILFNIPQYIKILAKFLFEYLSIGNMKDYITNFSYLGMGSGSAVFILLMIITAFTDKNEYDIKAYGVINKIVVLAVYVGGSALIATALYVAFTPVGADTVLGCQARYIIPLLYPLLAIIGFGFNNKINRTFYNISVISICAGVNLYNIYTVMLPYWVG